jgi:hypothetical protein
LTDPFRVGSVAIVYRWKRASACNRTRLAADERGFERIVAAIRPVLMLAL